MDAPVCRLLCIDLQVDPALDPGPAASAIFGARQLLALGRQLGWTIAHTHRRARSLLPTDASQLHLGAIKPLMSEKVFFHNRRSVADISGLAALLDEWRKETVYVAAFDHVGLLSCLLACCEGGPRFVLVEDVLPRQTLSLRSSEAFGAVAWQLAHGVTNLTGIITEANRRSGIPLSEMIGAKAVGEAAHAVRT
jgi:hypothetical protein